MFKVPDWEDDTSKVNLSFPKRAKTNKKSKKNSLGVLNLEGIIEPNSKSKSKINEKKNPLRSRAAKISKKNVTYSDNKVSPNVKKHSLKRGNVGKSQKKGNEANNIKECKDNKNDEKLYDTDKLDELILNEKKQKLNSYKKDDIEEILFNDNSENISVKNKNNPESHESTNKNKSINQLQNGKKFDVTKENIKNGAPKSTFKKRKRNNSENENAKKLHQLENQILNTKDKGKEDVETSTTLQNGNENVLENKKTNGLYQLEKNIAKRHEKKRTVQKTINDNGNKNIIKNKINKEINSSLGNKIPKLKDEKKKEALKAILQGESYRNSINVSGSKLRVRMLEKLKAAQFRYLNEKLYTSSGSDAKQLFQEDPKAFQTYHEGYQQQVKLWPVKPLDVIVKRIQKMPKTHTIADMGCGEAELAARVIQNVRSFDLVAAKPEVETCDMAHTPLLSSSMDVAVYCLALMGTDLTQYLIEANRVLKTGGHLLVAEVESRFHDVESFIQDVQKLGFSLKKIDKSQKVFFFMEFTKVREPPVKKAKLPVLSLKPCIYKKR